MARRGGIALAAAALLLSGGGAASIAAAPAPAPGDCGELVEAAGRGLEALHRTVISVSDTCLGFQNDVYQRFSGYVVKHRVALLCERILSVLEGLRLLAVGFAPRPRAAPAGGGGNCGEGREEVADAVLETAAEINRLEAELGKVLTDVNAAGDGSLQAVVKEHFDAVANNLLRAREMWRLAGASDAHISWPEIAAQMAEALSKLLVAVFEQLAEAVTYNVGELGVSNLPRFLSLLNSFPSTIPLDLRRGGPAEVRDGACRDVPVIYAAQHVFDPIADPSGWRSRDVAGIFSPRPSVQKLLFTISKGVPLAYNVIAVVPRAQVGSHELTSEYKRMFEGTGGFTPTSSLLSAAGLTAEPSCRGVGLAYSPAHCLFDLGWGSMIFSLSTEPPFDGVLAVSEMSQKSAGFRPQPFVQPVANASSSLDELIDLVDSVYKSLNTPSPDVLFLSPMVGNCLTLRKLGPSRRDRGTPSGATNTGPPQLTPKLVWVPVNPVIAPPWKLTPNFTAWHAQWLDRQSQGDIRRAGFQAEATWWFAQCSLASAVAVMAEQGYDLLHLEHSFAVFVLRGLWPALSPVMGAATGEAPPSLYDHWLRGWHCSPVAPTLFGLEWGSSMDLALPQDTSAGTSEQRRWLCEFVRAQGLPLVSGSEQELCGDQDSDASVGRSADAQALASRPWRGWELRDLPEERGKAYLLESAGRGRCLPSLGSCECFPPYRGRFCEREEPGSHDAQRPYRGVLHYLVGDREHLLVDFERTLPLLWERLNGRFDYPVVVFHDGMRPESRQRILEASPNRIWFALVDDYTAVPEYLRGRLELDLGGYNIGYRGMCRFRSGLMFTQPVMRNFDYAWTLDTDGYFPAEITIDPFERMHNGGFVYAYSHISRDQASAVQHFWEFCRLYLESKGIDPKGTKMMRRLTDALVLRDTYWHEWNRVLFMNDIEITRLSWFRSEQYQDFFRFLDSVGGFWLYRWGDHAVRTIAVALFLDPSLLMRMGVPYGHQNTCRCGDEHPLEVCIRATPTSWWQCVPRSEASSPTDGSAQEISGDVGTVDDSLMFGGS